MQEGNPPRRWAACIFYSGRLKVSLRHPERHVALIISVFLVVTSTVPVVAPDGTLVSISDLDMTLTFAALTRSANIQLAP